MEFANNILIVGGSAAGAGVAAKLRRLDEDAQITLIDKSRVVSYATCGIPYYLGNVIKDEERMRALSVKEFRLLLNVDVRTGHEVLSINRRDQVVEIRNLANGEIYQAHYDKLVLATGSVPNIANFDVMDAEQVFTIRGYEDTVAIKNYIHANSCQHALVVGAGLIGVETAENFQRLGLKVTLLEKSDQVLPAWDLEMAAVVKRHLRDKKIQVLLKDSVVSIKKKVISLASGRKLRADIVILALGVTPDVRLAAACGLRIGERGGIVVNSGLVTSDQHIFALGDAVEVQDTTLQKRRLLSLAGPAQRQARVVAENILGRHVSYQAPQGNAIVKVFNLTVATMGCNERQLVANAIPYLKSYTESGSNAAFYPGSQSMVIKLLFTPDRGHLLGAQIVGGAGVDKRIDVLSTAMQGKLTVEQLRDLELGYAPPYSSAKDPVNVAGMVATNMLREDYRVIHWDELDHINTENTVFVDVRSSEEFELRCMPGAIHIPVEELRGRMDEIPQDKRVIVYCGHGKKGYFAYQLLRHYGFAEVYNLSGGLTVFSMAKLHYAAATLSKPEKQAEENTRETIQGEPGIDELVIEALVSDGAGQQPSLVRHPTAPVRVEKSPELKSKIAIYEVDASGLTCPGPIMKLAKTMLSAASGDIVRITATDNAFASDVRTWCQKKGHKLLEFDDSSATIRAVLVKT